MAYGATTRNRLDSRALATAQREENCPGKHQAADDQQGASAEDVRPGAGRELHEHAGDGRGRPGHVIGRDEGDVVIAVGTVAELQRLEELFTVGDSVPG